MVSRQKTLDSKLADVLKVEQLAFYPISDNHADAWRVQALQPNGIGSVKGKIVCAEVLNQSEY